MLIDSAEEGVVVGDYPAFRRSGARPLAPATLLTRLGVLRGLVERRPQTVGLPPELGLQDRRALATAFGRRGFWRAARDEISAYDKTPAEMGLPGGFGALGNLPLTVIAHGRPMAGSHAQLEPGWRDGQARLSCLSSRGRLVVAERSGHAITVTEPELVAAEILHVVDQTRTLQRPQPSNTL